MRLISAEYALIAGRAILGDVVHPGHQRQGIVEIHRAPIGAEGGAIGGDDIALDGGHRARRIEPIQFAGIADIEILAAVFGVIGGR